MSGRWFGSEIKTVAKKVIPTVAAEAIGAAMTYGVSKALANKDKKEMEAQVASVEPSAPVEGSELRCAGYGLRRAGHFNGGAVIPIGFTKDEMIPILKFSNRLKKDKIVTPAAFKEIMKKIKAQHGGFLNMLLAGLAPMLLQGLMGQSGSGIKRMWLSKKLPLSNIDIKNYYKNNPNFYVV